MLEKQSDNDSLIEFKLQPIVNTDRDKINTLSLFTGGGGLDIGFHRANFRIVACVELDKNACETLRLNIGEYYDPSCNIFNYDIRDLDPQEVTQERIDFIIGGPPCQSFSAIGRRAGGANGILDDTRGDLFEHYCRFVKHFQPQGFLFENVRGILSSHKGEDWKQITKAFSDLGYHLFYRVLDCADYGVPQHRERIILVGVKEGHFLFPQPTHGPDSTGKTPYISAKDAVLDLQDPNEPIHIYSGKYGHLLSEVPPGQNYHFFTKEMGYPNPKFAWRSRFSDFLYKADPDKPVRTIVAQLGAFSGPFHWKNRKFSLNEFMRLQSFPDNYKFAGGLGAILKQIGNSVPPKFAEHLALAVKQQIFFANIEIDFLSEQKILSFDNRKSQKAKSTRRKRIKIDPIYQQKELFDILDEKTQVEMNCETNCIYNYTSSKTRMEIKQVPFRYLGQIYRVYWHRINGRCLVTVSRYDGNNYQTKHLLTYHILFKIPIGDGLDSIEAQLLSDRAEDIPVVWDAIEDYISKVSGYSTMMDIYGHFTEPRPIFTLHLDDLKNCSLPILKFAKKFSDFSLCSQILPEKTLMQLFFGNEENPSMTFTEAVKLLRTLRFDVRVHETNPIIPPKYFRCCYPFTINIGKQVSVTWKVREIDEVEAEEATA